MLIEALPFVMLGVVLSIVMQVWVPSGVIERIIPRSGWARRAVLSLVGMVIPVCECGNVPFARGLIMRGVGPADTLAFLVAAPIVEPDRHHHHAPGVRLRRRHPHRQARRRLPDREPRRVALQQTSRSGSRSLTERFAETCETASHDHSSRATRTVAQFIVELRAVMPALVIGSAIAGAVQVIVPRTLLVAIGSNPVLSIVAMVLLAITVAICSNVDAFFALSFAATFSPGSLVAFLLVGPVVDLKMIALLRTTFPTRVIAGLVAVVILAACAIAIGVNLLV